MRKRKGVGEQARSKCDNPWKRQTVVVVMVVIVVVVMVVVDRRCGSMEERLSP